MNWQPIETAPKDKAVRAGVRVGDYVAWPLTSRFIEGKWCALFDQTWRPYEPQPTHWKPTPPNQVADQPL